MEAKAVARRLLERFFENFSGNYPEDDAELLEMLESYLETDYFEPDDYGNIGAVYSYLRSAVDELTNQFEGEEKPRVYVIDSRVDYKDTQYAVVDTEKRALLRFGWFKWEDEPFRSVKDLLEFITESYEEIRKELEKLYGVSLKSYDPEEIAQAGEELYRELQKKAETVEEQV